MFPGLNYSIIWSNPGCFRFGKIVYWYNACVKELIADNYPWVFCNITLEVYFCSMLDNKNFSRYNIFRFLSFAIDQMIYSKGE